MHKVKFISKKELDLILGGIKPVRCIVDFVDSSGEKGCPEQAKSFYDFACGEPTPINVVSRGKDFCIKLEKLLKNK